MAANVFPFHGPRHGIAGMAATTRAVSACEVAAPTVG